MATDKVDIAGTNEISASQMSEFFRLAGIPEGSHINRKTFQDFLEKRNPFEGELPSIPRQTAFLKPEKRCVIPARVTPFDAIAFFESIPWVKLNSTLIESLRSGTVVTGPTSECDYYESRIRRTAHAQDLMAEIALPELSMLVDVAGLIEMQPNARPGFLANNGGTNVVILDDSFGDVRLVEIISSPGEYFWRVNGFKDAARSYGTGDRLIRKTMMR